MLARARRAGQVGVRVHDLRRFGAGPQRQVDDAPFGGGPGMILEARAVLRRRRVRARAFPAAERACDPALAAGAPLRSRGRQAGWPASIASSCSAAATKEWTSACASGSPTKRSRSATSCVTGGELPALMLIDAVARLVPGVLGNVDSAQTRASRPGLLDSPELYKARGIPRAVRAAGPALRRSRGDRRVGAGESCPRRDPGQAARPDSDVSHPVTASADAHEVTS